MEKVWRRTSRRWQRRAVLPSGGGVQKNRRNRHSNGTNQQFLTSPYVVMDGLSPGQMMHQKESGAAKYPGIKRQRPGIPAACIDSLRKKRIQPKYAHRQNYQAYSFFRCFTIRTRAPFCLLLYTGGLSPVKTECTLFSRDLRIICPLPPTGEPIPFAGHLPYPDPISLFPARPARPV